MLYSFLKFALGYAIKNYFREIQLRNEDRIPLVGPVIFLPNHRSAFMDPIVVAAYLKRRVHFLARGESFKNPVVAKILNVLSVIPIYRKAFSPNEMHKNEEVFQYCFKLLEENGALVIFPEGVSQTKPMLMPLKTGSARIALGAEEKNDFKLGVTLVPVGINYTNPHHFQGKLFLNFGRPIAASDYMEAYRNDPFKAVQDLTNQVESELKRRTTLMNDNRWAELVEMTEKIVQSDPKRFGIGDNEAHVGWFMARKDILASVEYFKVKKPDLLQSLELRVQQYLALTDRLKLTQGILNPLYKKQIKTVNPVLLVLYFLFGLPLFVAGALLHLLPFLLSTALAKKIVQRPDFTGSVLLILGLILFTINGFTLTWLIFHYTGNGLFAGIFFFLLPTSGIFAFQYFSGLQRLRYDLRLQSIGKRKQGLAKKVYDERESLLQIFKKAHEEYLNNFRTVTTNISDSEV
jgi:1-acyl-sn-glycerol-3-phosphate acyltransferase